MRVQAREVPRSARAMAGANWMGDPPATRPAPSPGRGSPRRAARTRVRSERKPSMRSSRAVPPKIVSSSTAPAPSPASTDSSDPSVRSASCAIRSRTAAASGGALSRPARKTPSSHFDRSASSSERPRSCAIASVRWRPPTGTERAAMGRPWASRQKVVLEWPRSTSSRVPSSSKSAARFPSTRPSASRILGGQPALASAASSSDTSERRAIDATTWVAERSPPAISQSIATSSRSNGRSPSTAKGTACVSLRRSRKGNTSRREEMRSPRSAVTTWSVVRRWKWTNSCTRSGSGVSSSGRGCVASWIASMPFSV